MYRSNAACALPPWNMRNGLAVAIGRLDGGLIAPGDGAGQDRDKRIATLDDAPPPRPLSFHA